MAGCKDKSLMGAFESVNASLQAPLLEAAFLMHCKLPPDLETEYVEGLQYYRPLVD